MLLMKPLIILLKKKPQVHHEVSEHEQPLLDKQHGAGGHDEHDFSEIFVH